MPVVSALFAQMDSRKQKIVLCSTSGIVLYLIYINLFVPVSYTHLDDHVAITGIFGIGREKSCSLCGELGSQFMIAEWEYPAIGVAICDLSLIHI